MGNIAQLEKTLKRLGFEQGQKATFVPSGTHEDVVDDYFFGGNVWKISGVVGWREKHNWENPSGFYIGGVDDVVLVVQFPDWGDDVEEVHRLFDIITLEAKKLREERAEAARRERERWCSPHRLQH